MWRRTWSGFSPTIDYINKLSEREPDEAVQLLDEMTFGEREGDYN